jgi:hypothetical protein
MDIYDYAEDFTNKYNIETLYEPDGCVGYTCLISIKGIQYNLFLLRNSKKFVIVISFIKTHRIHREYIIYWNNTLEYFEDIVRHYASKPSDHYTSLFWNYNISGYKENILIENVLCSLITKEHIKDKYKLR